MVYYFLSAGDSEAPKDEGQVKMKSLKQYGMSFLLMPDLLKHLCLMRQLKRVLM